MGLSDSAEVTDLVRLHLLQQLHKRFSHIKCGLYRDDALLIATDLTKSAFPRKLHKLFINSPLSKTRTNLKSF